MSLEGVREIWLGGTSSQGRLLWAEGMIIDEETTDLLDAKTPYCGDAPALGNIAKLLQVGSRIGRYNISLQTSERPYRWTLEFETAEETTSATWGMSRFLGYQMLALVENLDEVSFRYPSSSGVFTAELASASLARARPISPWEGFSGSRCSGSSTISSLQYRPSRLAYSAAASM